MQQISAIIIDDEPLAREGLLLRIQDVDDFVVIAQCADGTEALQVVAQNHPDVVFVDIEMPGLNGLELVERLQTVMPIMPKVVFVTAFREFALDAFEYQAFDYLLKPFTEERLQSCLAKLRHAQKEQLVFQQHDKLDELLCRKTGKSLDGFLDSLERSSQGGIEELQQTISLKSGHEWLRVKLDAILWIEAAGDYMCVHTNDGTHIIRKTLKQFEQELNSQYFPRISRSAIVNFSKVVRLTPNSNGEYIARLNSGDEVKVSRNFKLRLEELRKTARTS